MIPGWLASFADLRIANVTLTTWLAYHREHMDLRRA